MKKLLKLNIHKNMHPRKLPGRTQKKSKFITSQYINKTNKYISQHWNTSYRYLSTITEHHTFP